MTDPRPARLAPAVTGRRVSAHWAFFAGLLLGAVPLFPAPPARAGEDDPPLTRIQQVRALSPEQASWNPPVRLRGVVTFHDPHWSVLFVQDAGAAVFVSGVDTEPPLPSGSLVEVRGLAEAGQVVPYVRGAHVTVLGQGTRPEPYAPGCACLATGDGYGRWVALEGTIRDVTLVDRHLELRMAAGSERFIAYVPGVSDLAPVRHLVDAEVQVQGVCAQVLNDRRQPAGFKLLIPDLSDVLVRRASPP